MKKVFCSEKYNSQSNFQCHAQQNAQCMHSQFENTVNTDPAATQNTNGTVANNRNVVAVVTQCVHVAKSSAKSTGAKLACLVAFSLMLSACSLLPAKKSHTPSKPSVTTSASTTTGSATGSTSTSYGVAGAPLASQSYVANKQVASQGIVIASTRNACVDGFNFLKGMNQNQFGLYSEDYNRINQNYTFLNINKEIMDKDSKEVLSMTLNKKLDTLCTKVQYAGFIGVKDRIKELNAH